MRESKTKRKIWILKKTGTERERKREAETETVRSRETRRER